MKFIGLFLNHNKKEITTPKIDHHKKQNHSKKNHFKITSLIIILDYVHGRFPNTQATWESKVNNEPVMTYYLNRLTNYGDIINFFQSSVWL